MIAPVAVAGVLLAGVTTAGVAGTAYASSLPAATATSGAPGHSHAVKSWIRAHRHAIRKGVVTVSAAKIGVTAKALVSELRSGKSIADVAGEHNVSAQTMVDTLVAAADTQVTQAVTNHKLSSAQATKIDAALPGRITKLVNHTF